jgi:hypothetical protein
MKQFMSINAFCILFTLVALSHTAWAAAPANDNLAGAEIIGSTGVAYLGNNSEATKEPGEPNHALNAGGKSIWYKYTATASGYLTVYTTASTFDTTLAVYRGTSSSTVSTLYLLGSCDDIIPVTNNRSRVTIATWTGAIYYIAVDGHNEDGTVASGDLAVEFDPGTVAPNDAFANAVNLSPSGGELTTSNVNATRESGEPNHGGDLATRSLWYRFVAPVGATKSYSFSTRGSVTQGGLNSLYTLLAVYTGTSVNSLTSVASLSGPGRVTFIPLPGVTYYIAIDSRNYSDQPLNSAGTFTLKYGVTRNTLAADVDRDNKADISVFRPGTGVWYSIDSITRTSHEFHWGLSTDIPISGDLDQDGKSDRMVFRPETGTWYVSSSRTPPSAPLTFAWGSSGDIPQIYRDERFNYAAVFRPSNGTWYIRIANTAIIVRFGTDGDIPVMADYDGDGISDIAVFRPSTGVWYRLNSSNGQVVARQFGLNGDRPVVGDYDNDGRVDLAVYRPSTGVWWVLRSLNGSVQAVQWGITEDIPQPGDYDGDNRADFAVFRPSNGVWYVLISGSGTAKIVSYGLPGDKPVTATNFVH